MYVNTFIYYLLHDAHKYCSLLVLQPSNNIVLSYASPELIHATARGTHSERVADTLCVKAAETM